MQKELREVMKKYDIKTMAWAPFAEGMKQIEDMDTETDMILDITSMDEVYRLYSIRFEQ